MKESKVSFISKLNNLSERLKPKHFLFFQYLKQDQTELRNSDYSQLSHDQQSQILSKDDPSGIKSFLKKYKKTSLLPLKKRSHPARSASLRIKAEATFLSECPQGIVCN